jgi:hypothetical protein
LVGLVLLVLLVAGKFDWLGWLKQKWVVGLIDELVKNRNSAKFVIPAKAGIQLFQDVLDPGVRRGDGFGDFLRSRLS